jgi:hypothetical protein
MIKARGWGFGIGDWISVSSVEPGLALILSNPESLVPKPYS